MCTKMEMKIGAHVLHFNLIKQLMWFYNLIFRFVEAPSAESANTFFFPFAILFMRCNWIRLAFQFVNIFSSQCVINAYYSLFVMIIMGLNVLYRFILLFERKNGKTERRRLNCYIDFWKLHPFFSLSPAISMKHEYAYILMTSIITIIIIYLDRTWNWWIAQHVMQIIIIRCYILWWISYFSFGIG